MREATALRERAEFDVPGESESVVAGYRANNSLSLYFGQDPCYHFDAERRLRRAYIEGELYRTQGTTLARLHRDRSNRTVELRRHDLSRDELVRLVVQVEQRLTRLLASFEASTAHCIQEIPAGGQIASRLTGDLRGLTSLPLILAPAIAGRR